MVAEPPPKPPRPRIARNLNGTRAENERIGLEACGRHERVEIDRIMLPIAVDGEGMGKPPIKRGGEPGQECRSLAAVLRKRDHNVFAASLALPLGENLWRRIQRAVIDDDDRPKEFLE